MKPYHRNCTWILPGHSRLFQDSPFQWQRERTHGCWCSSWKLEENGEWKIWRENKWQKPKKGELCHSDNPVSF